MFQVYRVILINLSTFRHFESISDETHNPINYLAGYVLCRCTAPVMELTVKLKCILL